MSKPRVVPISPFLLLQELYRDDPWKIMVCCILLNKTRGKQVHGVREQLFRRWPDAVSMAKADIPELVEVIKPLGLYNNRCITLRRFSEQWARGDYDEVKDLYGIGGYALDSYSIFVENDLSVEPTDSVLRKYMEWRRKQTC